MADDPQQVTRKRKAGFLDQDLQTSFKSAPHTPGIYRMYGPQSKLLYVGKAKNLANRLKSYLDPSHAGLKTQKLLTQVVRVEFTITPTEADALLLESNIIKHDHPRYNIVLRDDKSYPYIRVDDTLVFPRLTFYRGRRGATGRFFGPYPDASAVRQTLLDLQKLFRLRNCSNAFFKNRTRPCLEHQIGRCSAPCVGKISVADYQRDFDDAIRVLEGRGRPLVNHIYMRMNELAEAQEFERAAALRDLMGRLQQNQEQEAIIAQEGDCDVWAIENRQNVFAAGLTRIRDGRNLGTWTWFPSGDALMDAPGVLTAFLPQYYEESIPPNILVDRSFQDLSVVEAALEKRAGHTVRLLEPKGHTAKLWLDMTRQNLKAVMDRRLASHALLRERFDALQSRLERSEPVERIICFDVSHTQGDETVASAIVYAPQGPVKPSYRRFNLKLEHGGDDYAGLDQALNRYFQRLIHTSEPGSDLLLIDGGVGQLRVAERRLEALGLTNLPVIAIAKGPERRVGEERLFLDGGKRELHWDAFDPAFHLLQQIRDEAHRFAITGHRRRRGKAQLQSFLDEVPGLGPKRRGLLLSVFGGLKGLVGATESDMSRIPGISQTLARRLYLYLHGQASNEIS